MKFSTFLQGRWPTSLEVSETKSPLQKQPLSETFDFNDPYDPNATQIVDKMVREWCTKIGAEVTRDDWYYITHEDHSYRLAWTWDASGFRVAVIDNVPGPE